MRVQYTGHMPLSVSHDQYTALPLVGVMMTSYVLINQYINLACLSVCLFVCLFVCVYPINVKTAEQIGPKFCVGHHGTTGKVYE